VSIVLRLFALLRSQVGLAALAWLLELATARWRKRVGPRAADGRQGLDEPAPPGERPPPVTERR